MAFETKVFAPKGLTAESYLHFIFLVGKAFARIYAKSWAIKPTKREEGEGGGLTREQQIIQGKQLRNLKCDIKVKFVYVFVFLFVPRCPSASRSLLDGAFHNICPTAAVFTSR